MQSKTKICYILPFDDEGTDTHLFYNYRFIEEAAKNIDIFKVVEKGNRVVNLDPNAYYQRLTFPPLRFWELIRKLFQKRKEGYDNFYAHYSYYGAFAGWLVSKFKGGRVFYWNRGMPWLFKRSWFEELIFKFILRNTILVTGPEALAREYVKYYGVKEYKVMPNWIDIERFKPTRSKEESKKRYFPGQGIDNKKIVLFVHHLSKRKGADLILDIAEGFRDKNIVFLVAGDGPEGDNLALKRKEKKMEDMIGLMGKMRNSNIQNLYHSADVFIMPSREEGSPHVILEAMASGTPFVASDVGGVRELVPKGLGELLCKSEDIKCFQDKIKMLLDDLNFYEKARTECISHSKNFDISIGVQEFINLFE